MPQVTDGEQPQWSPAASSVWGKSSGFEGDERLPLVRHLLDAADVAPDVWAWIPPLVRETIERDLPDEARDGAILLKWMAGCHDIGKVSPPFAAKVPTLADRMREQGLVLPRDTTDFSQAPHGLVGHVVLSRWLRDRYDADRRAASTYAVVVGGHHGVPPTNAALNWLAQRRDLVGTGSWIETQDEILDAMADYTGASEHLARWATHRLSPTVQSLLTGAVIVCDWLASDTSLFPFSPVDEHRTAVAWKTLGLAKPWHPAGVSHDAATLLHRRFPSLPGTPRGIQVHTVEAAVGVTTPPLVIVESTMGSGKTEAALMAGEILAEKFGCGGLYVGLPTMATSDAMFGRVLDWIENLDGGGITSVHLAHGKAGLNNDYSGLGRGHQPTDIHDDEPGRWDARQRARVEARVESWLTGRKKGVLASMVVGTIDQLLFMALQSKHVVLRQLAFAGKVVVIDEVHAADDFMRMYLCRALEWLAAFGVPVVLLSATLPSAQRREFADAYRLGMGASQTALVASDAYPLVTLVTAGEVIQVEDAPTVTPVTVAVRTMSDEPEALVTLLDDWLVDGGSVAVIRNTVRRAQETARMLRAHYGDDVVLHHSRFVATHRAAREETLRRELGRSGERPRRRIIVGTQVLEQSLDVDFDAIVTDLAPLDLILQRLGRAHRHDRLRPGRLTAPELVITGVTAWTSAGPRPDPGSTAVYGASRLLRAAGTLGMDGTTETTVTLPDDIRPLVETAYGDVPQVPEAWLPTVHRADADQAAKIADARRRANDFRIRSIAALDGSLVDLLEDSTKEAEESRGSARVRDSDDGLEVIVVQQVGNEVRYLDDNSQYAGTPIPVDAGGTPDHHLARALAACTVRLPMSMTRSSADFDRTVAALEAQGHEGWQESGWLAGQLVLHLDDSWRACVAGFDLTYTMTDGLTATAEEKT
ncbi:MAG: CRISPR-associated helicase Cas3' [Micrococcales bacterium]|nr:CRISPR-associated helicase Cas3' [Micrococcales bacterium]